MFRSAVLGLAVFQGCRADLYAYPLENEVCVQSCDHTCVMQDNKACTGTCSAATTPVAPQGFITGAGAQGLWDGFMTKKQAELDAASAGVDVMIVGDSFVEMFDAQWFNAGPCDVPNALGLIFCADEGQQAYKDALNVVPGAWAFAFSGDVAKDVVGRLEALTYPADFAPRAIPVLIGTNVFTGLLGDADFNDPQSVADGLGALVTYLRYKFPAAHVMVNSIWPRVDEGPDSNQREIVADATVVGDGLGNGISCCGGPAASDADFTYDGLWFKTSIDAANTLVEAWVTAQASSAISYVDCSGVFLDDDGKVQHLPDGFHPSAAGLEGWLNCMKTNGLDAVLARCEASAQHAYPSANDLCFQSCDDSCASVDVACAAPCSPATTPVAPQGFITAAMGDAGADLWNGFIADKQAQIDAAAASVDVMILGDSFIEMFDAQWFNAGPCDAPSPLGLVFCVDEGVDKYKDAIKVIPGAWAFGFAGDVANDVVGRLEAMTFPAGFAPRAIPVLIGTNVFTGLLGGVGFNNPQFAADGVISLVTYLRNKFPAAHVMVNSIWPRVDEGDAGNGISCCGGPAAEGSDFTYEGTMFKPLIDTTNALVSAWVAAQDSAVSYVDCSEVFLADGKVVNIPDGFHPNAAGLELWLGCMQTKGMDKTLSPCPVPPKEDSTTSPDTTTGTTTSTSPSNIISPVLMTLAAVVAVYA